MKPYFGLKDEDEQMNHLIQMDSCFRFDMNQIFPWRITSRWLANWISVLNASFNYMSVIFGLALQQVNYLKSGNFWVNTRELNQQRQEQFYQKIPLKYFVRKNTNCYKTTNYYRAEWNQYSQRNRAFQFSVRSKINQTRYSMPFHAIFKSKNIVYIFHWISEPLPKASGLRAVGTHAPCTIFIIVTVLLF